MPGEGGYLEKYSVAPAPSRDYYGIRILPNEVKLFLWKISHGPHITPIVINAKFDEFAAEKSLQDEIHRVFGKSLLDWVIEITASGANSWTINSCDLDRAGWARVLREGQSMQKTENKNVVPQLDKKRDVRGNVTLTMGLKGNVSSKIRSKILAKTPLEVVKTNPTSRKTILAKSSEVAATSPLIREITTRRVNDVSEKVSRLKFEKSESDDKAMTRGTKSDTKMVPQDNTGDYKKMAERDKIAELNKTAKRDKSPEHDKMAIAARNEKKKMAEKARKNVISRKSTILKTDKSLAKGLSSFQKKDITLAELIRQDTKKLRNEPSTFNDSRYLNCLDDIAQSAAVNDRKSNEFSSGNYAIENPWSSNSSIASISSPINPSTGRRLSSKTCDRSYLTDKYKSAREFLAKQRSSKDDKEMKITQRTTITRDMEICEKNSTPRIETTSRFSKPGMSATQRLDAINRLTTLGNGNKNRKSLNSNVSRIAQTSSKNLVCPKNK